MNKKNMRLKELALSKSKGFTLIELLIVIAVIAILATIVIINVAGARQKANDSRVLQNLQGVQTAIMQCAAVEGVVTLVDAFTPTAGGAVCTDSLGATHAQVRTTYPNITAQSTDSGTWAYDAVAAGAGYVYSSGFFTFSASTGSGNTITCKQTGCSKTGF